jgi:hypothetical protein
MELNAAPDVHPGLLPANKTFENRGELPTKLSSAPKTPKLHEV